MSSSSRSARVALGLAIAMAGGCNALLGFDEGTPVEGSGGAAGTATGAGTGGTTTGAGSGASATGSGSGGGLPDCTGDPTTGDGDDDGVCDDLDQCLGDDASGDADADGVCDSDDLCPGFTDHGDGSCTQVFVALADLGYSNLMHRCSSVCPPDPASPCGGPGTGETEWHVRRHGCCGPPAQFHVREGFVSFDTAPLPDTAVVQAASLTLSEAPDSSTAAPVALRGGDFGTIEYADLFTGALLGSKSQAEIDQAGNRAVFTAGLEARVNPLGLTQFEIGLDVSCLYPDVSQPTNPPWKMVSPTAAQDQPELSVRYAP